MNLTKIKKIFFESINADMFDDAEFYEYMHRCFNNIDSVQNEMNEVQATILLTVATSIAKTLGSIREGEHDDSITEEDKQVAQEKERLIIEYMDYLTSHSPASFDSDADNSGELVAQ